MSKWDEKAKNYSRYTEGEDRFEANVLQSIKNLHVNIKNRSIIDIGCGTGVYTLRVAGQALHVDGVDSSKEMLEVLKEDAKILNLTNINTFVKSWDQFILPTKKYNIALCTMSPAVNNEENYIKMTNCATTKIYLGWAGKRSSAVLEEIFKAHDKTYTAPNGAAKLRKWLDYKSISYQLLEFDEERETKKEFDKAVENFAWHLEVRGVTPDKNKIKKVLEEFCDKDRNIVEKMTNHMNLLVW